MNRNQWLEEALTQWEVPLLRTCYLMLRDAALAEDAVQETFIKAWRAYDTRRDESSDKAFLMRIAVNTCRDLMRSKWLRHIDRRVSLSDLPEPAAPFTPPDDAVTRAVLSLPSALRQAVTLRYYQGFSVQEIADMTRASRRTIHYRLQKAERLLKNCLEEWYHDT